MRPTFAGAAAYAVWPVRLTVASVMLYHGWEMLTGLPRYVELYGRWGIPAGAALAPLVAVAEFFGGLGLVAGVLTRFTSAVLSVVMVMAIVAVRKFGPFLDGWALDWVLLGGLLALLANGPGRPTLASALGKPWLDPEELLAPRLLALVRTRPSRSAAPAAGNPPAR